MHFTTRQFVRIAGTCPGTIELHVSGDHLRQQFLEPGDLFVLRLGECSMLRFRPYGAEALVISDPVELARADLQILSAHDRVDYCQVRCHALRGSYGIGTLEVSAGDARLTLDSGREISLGEIQAASAAYWRSEKGTGPSAV